MLKFIHSLKRLPELWWADQVNDPNSVSLPGCASPRDGSSELLPFPLSLHSGAPLSTGFIWVPLTPRDGSKG